MNICFNILKKGDQEAKAREAKFVADAKAIGLTGLAGHRSVGGIRASNCEFDHLPSTLIHGGST